MALWTAIERRESIHIRKKWYGTIEDTFASPMLWMPMPVRICWSEYELRSLRRRTDSEELLLRASWKMREALRIRETAAVMMKDRRTC